MRIKKSTKKFNQKLTHIIKKSFMKKEELKEQAIRLSEEGL